MQLPLCLKGGIVRRVPVLALLALALSGLVIAQATPQPPAARSAWGDFEALAAVAGRGEAWYLVNGYTAAPPPAAEPARPPPAPPASAAQEAAAAVQIGATAQLSHTLYFPLVSKGPWYERRAIWVTRYDWTSLDSDTPPMPERIDEIVDNVAGAGFNTVFFQVRAAGDAYYTPGLEPWAARLTGSACETLEQDPGWDPLARLLEKAHAAGLEVHAYVNVYPAWLPPADDKGQCVCDLWPPATDPPQTFDRLTYSPDNEDHPGEYGLGWTWRHYDAPDSPMLLTCGRYLWASPGVDEVQDHIVAVIVDLVSRYAVDGVHLDLARYAGPDYSYDPFSNDAAGTEKTEARDQWQRDRVTNLVRQVHAETDVIKPGLLVSAAVWPYYEDKWDLGVNEGYTHLYQDSKGWLTSGAVDAIAPMLYGNGASIPDDFDIWCILMNDFLAASAGRHVYPGIGGYYDDFGAIAQRIEAARQAGAPGHAIFSYGALNSRSYWDDLAAGPYAQPIAPPPHP